MTTPTTIIDLQIDDLEGAIAIARAKANAGELTSDRARTLLRKMVDEEKQDALEKVLRDLPHAVSSPGGIPTEAEALQLQLNQPSSG